MAFKASLAMLATASLLTLAHAQSAMPAASGAMQMDAAAMTDGEVRKVDMDSKKITLRHGEIKNLGMPGMTMVFQVKDPAMLDKVKAGDKVRFTAEKINGAFTVMTLAANAELIDVTWDAQQQFSRNQEVAPTQFIELCGKLTAATTVAWQFEANEMLNFNVHYHEGKEVRFPAKQDGVAKLQGELKVERDQDYCWMWTNKGQRSATLSVTLKKQ